MQKVWFVLCFFLAGGLQVSASDSCTIFLNKQAIFKGEVDQEKSTAKVKAKRLTGRDCITIIYNSETTNKGWTRTFYINGPEDKNIKTITLGKQSGSITVKASILNEMKNKKLPVSIYTISLPTDKSLAARIRVRRMFICKIEWN